MQLSLQLKPSPVKQNIRKAYLTGLPFAQEYYLESLIQDADTVAISIDHRDCGYALISGATLLEYYPDASSTLASTEIFTEIVNQYKISKILCKSFDQSLMDCCARLHWSERQCALLYRELKKDDARLTTSITVHLAKPDDMSEILDCHDGFFEDEEEIKSYMQENARLFIYRLDGQTAGLGIAKQIVDCRNDYDIGMVVAPAHRLKGLGTQIVGNLADYCLKHGFNPVAGCSTDNPASSRALHKAGFRSNYYLLEYQQKD